MPLDLRTASLVAVGASVAANCRPCLELSVARALESGAQPSHVADAIQVGRNVRTGAGANLDSFAATLGLPTGRLGAVPSAQCRCGGTGADRREGA